MKKIIYSLVIMMAAGCLFTSCVENTVDQGRQDLLQAKADYLNALSNLRAADAELVKAQAATETAKQAVIAAQAALEQAKVEAQKIANEAAQAMTDVAKAKADSAIAVLKAKAEAEMLKAQTAQAKAQQELDTLLRNIAAMSTQLTSGEKAAFLQAITDFRAAEKEYIFVKKQYDSLYIVLWNKKYDHAAGYDTLAVDDYTKSVKLKNYEAYVAAAQTAIADEEALQEVLNNYKGNFDVIKEARAGIAEIKDSLALLLAQAKADSALYYTSDFLQGKAAYADKVKQFVADSIEPYAYYFGAYKGTTPVAKTYEVKGANQMYNLAADFAAYTDTLSKYAGSKAAKYTVTPSYTTEPTVFTMGPTYVKTAVDTVLAGKADEFLGLEGVVEALNRDMVVTGKDSTWKQRVEAIGKLSKKLDSTYAADRKFVESGFDSTFPGYVDSMAKVKAATKAVAAAKVDSAAAFKVCQADTVLIKTSIKAAAAAYIAAVEGFAKAYNDIVTGGIEQISETDRAAFTKAANALGVAKAAYLGKQDTLKVWKKDVDTSYIVGIPFSELKETGFQESNYTGSRTDITTSGLVYSLYGGIGYGEFATSQNWPAATVQKAFYKQLNAKNKTNQDTCDNNPFVKVASIAAGAVPTQDAEYTGLQYKFASKVENAGVFTSPALAVSYDKTSALAFDMGVFTDTLIWYQHVATTNGDLSKTVVTKTAFAKAEADKTAYDKECDTVVLAKAALATAETNFGAVETAYTKMYQRFFGDTTITFAAAKEGQILNYSRATFEEPFDCAQVNQIIWQQQHKLTINDNPTLSVVLSQLGYNLSTANDCDIFNKVYSDGLHRPTLYTELLFAKQSYNLFQNWTTLEDQLKEITAVVAQIKADHEAACASQDKYDEQKAKLTGSASNPIVYDLTSAYVKDGAWNLAGLQKQWADELVPDFPTICQNLWDIEEAKEQRESHLNEILETMDDVVSYFTQISGGTISGQIDTVETYAELVSHIKTRIENSAAKIADYKTKIDSYKKAIAQIEAGVDEYSVEIARLESLVAYFEARVKDAEEILASAQAKYDAVKALLK